MQEEITTTLNQTLITERQSSVKFVEKLSQAEECLENIYAITDVNDMGGTTLTQAYKLIKKEIYQFFGKKEVSK